MSAIPAANGNRTDAVPFGSEDASVAERLYALGNDICNLLQVAVLAIETGKRPAEPATLKALNDISCAITNGLIVYGKAHHSRANAALTSEDEKVTA